MMLSEERRQRRAARANAAFTILVVLVYHFLLVGGAFIAGASYEERAAKERQARTPRKVEVVTSQVSLSCDRRGIEEWYRTCRARERMEKVK